MPLVQCCIVHLKSHWCSRHLLSKVQYQDGLAWSASAYLGIMQHKCQLRTDRGMQVWPLQTEQYGVK